MIKRFWTFCVGFAYEPAHNGIPQSPVPILRAPVLQSACRVHYRRSMMLQGVEGDVATNFYMTSATAGVNYSDLYIRVQTGELAA